MFRIKHLFIVVVVLFILLVLILLCKIKRRSCDKKENIDIFLEDFEEYEETVKLLTGGFKEQDKENYLRYVENYLLIKNIEEDQDQNIIYKYSLDENIDLYKTKHPTAVEVKLTLKENSNSFYYSFIKSFLLNFKQDDGKTNFNLLLDKTNFETEGDFKSLLKLLWKFSILTLKDNSDLLLYNQLVEGLIDKIESELQTRKRFPFNYDWYLYALYYPLILNYYLIINFENNDSVDKRIYSHFNYFIPEVNYSINIKREGSNLYILFMNYNIFNFLKGYIENKETSFMKVNLNSENLALLSSALMDEIFLDGGFIFHSNVISYNYLLGYLYPLLYFNGLTSNERLIDIVLHFIFKIIHLEVRKVNPKIISRYGMFDEVYKGIYNIFNSSKKMNVLQDNKYLELFNNILNKKEKQKEFIYLFHSIKMLSVVFKDWSFILTCTNNKTAIGEVDKYNSIVYQSWMSKIITIKELDIKKFDETSLVPGVLFSKKDIIKRELLTVKKGVKSFLVKVKENIIDKINNHYAFSYSDINASQFNISFKEFVLTTPDGIFVSYFDIFPKGLILCIDSPIYKNKISSGVLYTDSKDKEIINFKHDHKTYKLVKVNQNIIYYNLVESFDINIEIIDLSSDIKNFVIKYNNAEIGIKICKKYIEILFDN